MESFVSCIRNFKKNKMISKKLSGQLLLVIVVAFSLFHVSILLGIIPYEITWGGRLKTNEEMYVFESVSLLVMLFFGTMVLMKQGMVRPFIPLKAVHVILWVFFGLFVLNTVGNFLAVTLFEKFFAIVTLLISYFIWNIQKK